MASSVEFNHGLSTYSDVSEGAKYKYPTLQSELTGSLTRVTSLDGGQGMVVRSWLYPDIKLWHEDAATTRITLNVVIRYIRAHPSQDRGGQRFFSKRTWMVCREQLHYCHIYNLTIILPKNYSNIPSSYCDIPLILLLRWCRVRVQTFCKWHHAEKSFRSNI